MTMTSTPRNGPATGRHVAAPTDDVLHGLRERLTGHLVTTDDDVVTTVRFAADHGLAVAAQPSGHAATTAVSGTFLLRTGALQNIWIAPDARVACVGAGVRWGRLQSALKGTGLTGLVGSNPDVTVVGCCLGGGLSWFSRAFGCGAGALRGGDGDLAIMTAVEIDLFPAPETYGELLAFPGDAARPVLGAFAETTRTAPDELTLWAMLMHLPDVELLPPEARGQSFTVVGTAFLGMPDGVIRGNVPIPPA